MRVCANLSFLFKENGPLLNRFEAAANAGFRCIEFDFPSGFSPQEVGDAVKSSGLEHVLVNCFQGNQGEMGFAANPGQELNFQNSLERTLDYTKATNCKKIHILSGQCLGPQNLPKQTEALEKNLRWAAQRLSKEGVVGLIEPINPYSKPGYFLNSYDIAVSVLEKVDSPFIRLQLDLFHLQLIAGNITNSLKRLLPYTGHIQVAQSPQRHEPSFPGEVDFKYVFSLLRDLGYQGHIGAEYTPSKSSVESLMWVSGGEYGVTF